MKIIFLEIIFVAHSDLIGWNRLGNNLDAHVRTRKSTYNSIYAQIFSHILKNDKTRSKNGQIDADSVGDMLPRILHKKAGRSRHSRQRIYHKRFELYKNHFRN